MGSVVTSARLVAALPAGAALAAATLAAATLAGARTAEAAALERAVPQVLRLLYEDGTYGEAGVVYADPHQSGEGASFPTGATTPPITVPGNTGDVFGSTTSYFAAWKGQISDRLSYVLGFDQPYGVNTRYGQGSFASPQLSYTGTEGDLDAYQFTGVLAYDVTPNVKLFAGLRAERIDADAAVPFVLGYRVSTNADWGYGYLIGAAYARPEMALRVGLTYQSKIEHSFDADESTLLASQNDSFSIDTPQSVTLDFQTGVTPKTLVFGSVRWVNWADFSIAPPLYVQTSGLPLVDYSSDWWTYTLGVGQQLTENLAGSLSVAWEPSVGGTMTTLGPYDGSTVGTAALSYDWGRLNLTGALSYGVLGDTENRLGTGFDDGWVWGGLFRVGYSF